MTFPGVRLPGYQFTGEAEERGRMFRNFTISALAALSLFCCSRGVAQEPDRTIEIHAHRYAFSPPEITIRKGETVRLKLFSDDVTHSLLIKGLGVDQAISKGHPAEVTLTPKQDGDFQAQCGHFCGSGHGKMLMTVHVTGD
jgi:cytochrome c oxidase subunit 2